MTEQRELPAPHPVLDFARRGRGRLGQLQAPAARPVWTMATEELGQALLDLAVMAHQLEALRLGVLAEAERRGTVAGPGDRTVADWVARTAGQTRPAALSDLKLAMSLDAEHLTLGAAMANGHVSPAQAKVIARCLDLLPTTGEFTVTPEERGSAEAHLVGLADRYDAEALEVLGRRIYTVIAPDAAEAYEGRLLEAEEARAAPKVVLETWTDHQGLTHGQFRIPQLHGAMLTKALEGDHVAGPPHHRAHRSCRVRSPADGRQARRGPLRTPRTPPHHRPACRRWR